MRRTWIPALAASLALGFTSVQANPLAEIGAEMKVVKGELEKTRTGAPTQEKQEQIVRKLDDVIAELEKQCQACKNGGRSSTSRPTRPAGASNIIGGPGGAGDLRAPKTSPKKWAELSPRERDRILQSMSEGFPPHYRQVLERYYQRLAEEQARDEAPPAAKP